VNTRLKPSESAPKTVSKLSESISFDIEDDGTKATVAPTARPTSKLAAKGQVKDKAGAGWVRASKAEIKDHFILQSPNMIDDRYLPNEFLEDCIGCSQPPTDQLPSITNHYTFIRVQEEGLQAIHGWLQTTSTPQPATTSTTNHRLGGRNGHY
jgi:hypothetical protein